MTKERERSGLADANCRAVSALVMSESGGDLDASKELLQLPRYRVQTCSSYIELLLHLEHATYELVIIFEDDDEPSPEWHSVIKQVASSSSGALVLVFKRSEELTSRPGVSAKQN